MASSIFKVKKQDPVFSGWIGDKRRSLSEGVDVEEHFALLLCCLEMVGTEGHSRILLIVFFIASIFSFSCRG